MDIKKLIYSKEYIKYKIVSSNLKHKYTPIKLNPYEIYVGISCEFEVLSLDMINFPHIVLSGDFSSGKSTEIGLMLINLIYNHDSKYVNIYLCNTFNTSDFYILENCNQVKASVFSIYNIEKILKEIIDIYNERVDILKEFYLKNLNEYNEKFPDEPLPYIYIVINNLDDLMPLNNLEDNYKEKVKCCNFINFIISRGIRAGIFLIMETENLNISSMYFNITNRLCAKISFSNIIDKKTIIDRKTMYTLGIDSEEFKVLYIDDKLTKKYIKKSLVDAPKSNLTTLQKENFDCEFNIDVPKKAVSRIRKVNKNYDTYQ